MSDDLVRLFLMRFFQMKIIREISIPCNSARVNGISQSKNVRPIPNSAKKLVQRISILPPKSIAKNRLMEPKPSDKRLSKVPKMIKTIRNDTQNFGFLVDRIIPSAAMRHSSHHLAIFAFIKIIIAYVFWASGDI